MTHSPTHSLSPCSLTHPHVDVQACPFQMDVYCEACPPSLQPLSLDWGPRLLNQALQKSIVASVGEARALRGHDNVLVYTYRGEHRISSLVANKVERGWILLLGMGTSSKFQTRGIEGIP